MSENDAAAASGDPALPKDIVVEILARVPDMVSLFRCSVACKRWRCLMADPAFLRRRVWPEGGRSSLLGFFVQRNQLSVTSRRKITKLFPTRAPAFVPAPESVLGPERRFLTSFVRDVPGLLDQAKPLAVRDGLLLVRISHRSRDKNNFLRLCVCDLLAGKQNHLPPLDLNFFDGEGIRGYAVLTAADHGAGPHWPVPGYSTVFQVLLICARDYQMHLLQFSSSATASCRIWTRYNCSSRFPGGVWGPFGCRTAAVSSGTAHWLFHGNGPDLAPSLYALKVRINTTHVSVTKLPLDVLPHIIRGDRENVWLCLDMDARLSLLCVKNNFLLTLAREDRGQNSDAVWHHTRASQVGVELGLFGIESLSSVCVGERSGTLLALYRSEPERAYLLDLQTGSTTKIAGWNRSFNYMTAVPYEINWQAFLKSRLGTCQ